MTYTFWFSEAGSLSSLKDTFGAGEGNQSKPSQVTRRHISMPYLSVWPFTGMCLQVRMCVHMCAQLVIVWMDERSGWTGGWAGGRAMHVMMDVYQILSDTDEIAMGVTIVAGASAGSTSIDQQQSRTKGVMARPWPHA